MPRPRCSATQYAAFEPVPGAHINPELTMGENVADFAGIQVALDAYHRSLGGKPAPVIDGLTGDQRFFLAYAQDWREKQREDALRSQVTTDPHSPGRFRVLGPLPNIDAWYRRSGSSPTMRCTSRRRSARTSGSHGRSKKKWGVAVSRLPLSSWTYHIRTRSSGAIYCRSPGLIAHASYHASMFRSGSTDRTSSGEWLSVTSRMRRRSGGCSVRQI